MSEYSVYVIDHDDKAMLRPNTVKVWEGNRNEVNSICEKTIASPKYRNRTMRVFDHRLFGGGIQDVQII